MTDTHASIATKGLDNTGITEDLADELFHKVGTHLMAIVDLQVVDRSGPNVKDKRKVHLIIDGIEPATDDAMAEHLRELSRVGYLNRAHANGTIAINQELDNERTVADVLAAGARHKPHPFLPVDASIDNGICDVCGSIEATPVHSSQATLPDGDDEGDEDEADGPTDGDTADDTDDTDDTEEGPEPTEPAAQLEEPWEYDQPEGANALRSVTDPFTASNTA